MKQMNTGLLLLILAAIVVVLFLLVNPPQFGGGAEKAVATPYAALERDAAATVTVKTLRGQSTLRRAGEDWVVEEFDDFPADETALEEAFTDLREMELGDVVSENVEKQADLQVDGSGIEVFIADEGGDELAHFFLGKPGTDYRRIYYREDGSDQVYLVDQRLRGRFDRGARTWRNRRPFSFEIGEVSALHLAAGETGEELTLELDNEGNWVVVGEEPIPADKAKVELVARSFAQLSADEFPDEQNEDISAYGLDEPEWTYTARLLDGSERTLLVGGTTEDENRRYVKRGDSPIIYIMGGFRLRNLSKTLDEVRLDPEVTAPAEER